MPSETRYWVIDIDAEPQNNVPSRDELMMSVPVKDGPFDTREDAEEASDGVEYVVVSTIQMVQP